MMSIKKICKNKGSYPFLDFDELEIISYHFATNRTVLLAVLKELRARSSRRERQLYAEINSHLKSNTHSENINPFIFSSRREEGSRLSDEIFKDLLRMHIASLKIERNAIKSKIITISQTLKCGKKTGENADGYCYQFSISKRSKRLIIGPEDYVSIWVGGKRVSGNIIYSGADSITLCLKVDLGDKTQEVKIKKDPTYLIQCLINLFTSLINYRFSNYFCESIFNMIHGLSEPYTCFQDELLVDRGILDDEQWRAVQMAAGSNFSIIWGPPGTGKTESLIPILEQYYREGKRVLVTSHTNAAVDKLFYPFCKVLHKKNDPGFQNGRVQRHGKVVMPALQNNYFEMIDKDSIINRQIQRYNTKISEQIYDIIKPLERTQDYFSKVINSYVEVEDFERLLLKKEQLQSKLETINEHILTVDKEKACITRGLRVKRLFRFLNFIPFFQTVKLEMMLTQNEYAASKLKKDFSEIKQELSNTRNKLSESRADYFEYCKMKSM